VAAPSDKKLGKITSTKVGSIYPTLTPTAQAPYDQEHKRLISRSHVSKQKFLLHEFAVASSRTV
ncbi:hypothetical protein, partial [Burkholderia ubonensis]|uniref:hypothetical protein n=1 Tax=Burkholderia ubonensis TaxID=101571 RepID=UPI001E555AD4